MISYKVILTHNMQKFANFFLKNAVTKWFYIFRKMDFLTEKLLSDSMPDREKPCEHKINKLMLMAKT